MQSPLSFYRSQSEKSKSIIVFCAVVFTAVLVFFIAKAQMGNVAVDMMEPYSRSQALIQKHIDSMPKPVLMTEPQFKTLLTQQKILGARKTHYLDLSQLFFRNYYGVLILTMLFSCVGGIVLFIVINKGWGGSSEPLRSLFLAIIMVVTFCGFFPVVFKQQENFNQNIGSYMNYTKAEVNILNQLSALQNVSPYRTIDTIEINNKDSLIYHLNETGYLHTVDSLIDINTITINNLTNYILTIDAREIKSIGAVYRTVANSLSGGSDSTKIK